MTLERLALRRFRNFTEADLECDPDFNVIWGKNAQGKTNLLEAVYLLGYLKSFRSGRNSDLIRHDEESAWLGGTVTRQGVDHRLELSLLQTGRRPRVNGKSVKRLTEFLGYLRPVLFTPEEMGLIKGYPAGRRSLLDRAILQTDPVFLERVQEYERVLKQRNQLLKSQADPAQLEPWTTALISTGSRIRYDRNGYLDEFRPRLKQVYREISSGTEEVDIHSSVVTAEPDELSRQMKHDLERLKGRERQVGQTLVGPHRDDLEFLLDRSSLRLYGSQGQQRSFLLAFKAAQVLDLEQRLGESPVLLLDDLASELDQQRQAGFFEFMLARKGQVFLTTTQPDMFREVVSQKATFTEVAQGQITK